MQRAILSVGNFFITAHWALAVFVLTPYLATLLPGGQTGLVITAGAAITLLTFPFVPRMVRKVGVKRLTLLYMCAGGVALLALALSPSPVTAIVLVAVLCSLQPIIGYLLDLLLEAIADSALETGRIRTAFLTFSNLTYVVAPLLVGYLLGTGDDYARVFLFGATSIIVSLVIFSRVRVEESVSPSFGSVSAAFHCLVRDTDFRATGIALAALQFFYHLAPFFIPLYLHSVLGIPWSELGWMFSLMILPFVLLEYPAGWLADRFIGDRELMALGFLIMGTSFAALAFVTASTPLVSIAIVLILTRIGAALVESMTESHIFRRVSASDMSTVGVLRMIRPVFALTAPLIGTLVLFYSTYAILFFVAGIVIIAIGIASALSIKDVR